MRVRERVRERVRVRVRGGWRLMLGERGLVLGERGLELEERGERGEKRVEGLQELQGLVRSMGNKSQWL